MSAEPSGISTPIVKTFRVKIVIDAIVDEGGNLLGHTLSAHSGMRGPLIISPAIFEAPHRASVRKLIGITFKRARQKAKRNG